MNNGNENQSSFGPGMEEQHQELGGMPGGDFREGQSQGGVRGMASKAGEKLMDTAERQKMAGADFVENIAESVRRAAGEFEGQVPQAAQYIRYAADQIDVMTDSLRRRDIGQMMSDVQSFARRQPTAFLGLSFLAGFAAIRFLRSGASANGDRSSWQGGEPNDDGRYGAAGDIGGAMGSSGMGSSGMGRSGMGGMGSGFDDRSPGTGL